MLSRRRPRVLLFGNVTQEPYCNNLLPVVAAFRRLSNVHVIEPRRLPGFVSTGGARPAAIPPSALSRVPRRFNPDLVICLAGGLFLEPGTRERLPAGALTIGLALSDPLGLEASLAIATSFDLFYSQDPHTVPLYGERGLHVDLCLPAVDPRLYRPRPGGTPCDILYVGKWTPYRDRLITALADRFQVRVHSDLGENRFSVPVQPPINTPAKLARAYSAARLGLEISLVEQPGNPLDGSHRLTNRPQFAAACGTPSLAEAFDELPRFFQPGREVAVYTDEAELVWEADRLLADASARRRMGQRARNRVRHHHTWGLRARQVLHDATELRSGRT